jgi:hypothetical protein
MIVRRRSRLAGMFATLALLAPLLVVQPALAAGTVTPAKTELEDLGEGSWKLLITIKLGKKPATAHRPVRFIFTPLAIYETFLDDTKPGEQTRSIPQGKDVAPLVETLDVSFGDVQGNLWDTTKFDFVIKRARGFEAGEYKVELRDDEDKAIGSPFKLKLAGKNAVIDRRAMVFAGNDSKKKKEKPEEKKDDGAPAPKKDDAPPPPPPADKKDSAAAQPPPEVKPKQGGCGCQAPGSTNTPSSLAVVSVVALALGGLRRRRLVGPGAGAMASARGVPGHAPSPLDRRGSGPPRGAPPARFCALAGGVEPTVARRRGGGPGAGPFPGAGRRSDLDLRVPRAAAAAAGQHGVPGEPGGVAGAGARGFLAVPRH